MNAQHYPAIDAQTIGKRPRNLRAHNINIIMTLFRYLGTTSASVLSAQSGLSLTTINKILSQLLEDDILLSVGKGDSTSEGGKKPELFTLNPQFCYSIGCHIHRGTASIALVNFAYQTVAQASCPQPLNSSFEESLTTISQQVDTLLSENKIKSENVCGFTLCLEGVVDTEHQKIVSPIGQENWSRNVNVKKLLEHYLRGISQRYILNGTRAYAYASYSLHPELMGKDVYYILPYPVGCGGCLIHKGKIVTGVSNYLGELGHMIIRPDYRLNRCRCGQYGCFESLVSLEGVQAQIKALHAETSLPMFFAPDTSIQEKINYLYSSADAGNSYAVKIIDLIAENIYLTIRNVLLLNDPELIILCGPYFCGQADRLRNKIVSLLKSDAVYTSSAPDHVQFYTYQRDDSTTPEFGGAFYAIQKYLARILQ